MPLVTTTIGAYPKPEGTPVPLWTEMGPERKKAPTAVFDPFVSGLSDHDRAEIARITREVVEEQVACGIEVPTDGEIGREHYVYYHCRHIGGIDFTALSERSMRDGSWVAQVPTVRAALQAGEPFLPQDWRIAQAATERDVKITVPGPLTISDTIADAHYPDRRSLALALADVLNVEIRRLAEAGCRWIQVDEPLFARMVDDALAFGVECAERCFAGTRDTLNRVVHICCGYPAGLDDPNPAKADATAYLRLAEALDEAKVDAVSLEDAHRRNDPRLFEMLGRTKIILGVVDIASSRIEPVEEIRSRLEAVLGTVDASRLIAAPDCGLALLPHHIAVAKLRNLAEAARSL